MKISGTYIERLLWIVLPWTIFVGLFTYLIEGRRIEFVVIGSLTVLLWLMDTMIIYFKFKPSTLKHTDSKDLILNSKKINTTDIHTITPIYDQRMKWSFKMIKFTLTDGQSIMIIDKPQTFIEDIMNKPSKTLKILFENYPDLKSKLTLENYI